MSYQFYVGQKVVCIESGRACPELLRAGDVYSITGITEPCRCGKLLTVGIPRPWSYQCPVDRILRCGDCGMLAPSGTNEWEFLSSKFRPLDELEATMDRLEKEGCPTSLPEPVLG